MHLEILHQVSPKCLKENGHILIKKIIFLLIGKPFYKLNKIISIFLLKLTWAKSTLFLIHMPLSKKTSKYKLKFKTKPQITSGLMLLKMFFHLKEPWCEII